VHGQQPQGRACGVGDVLWQEAPMSVFPSIRAQLTAWLALLVTLCLAAFALYLYVAVAQILTADLDQTLRGQAHQVANLLLLARADEARTIDRRPVELDVLLLEVARQARALAQGVTVTIGHEDQAVVRGDADLLKQLVLNLVDNPLTYTPPGGRVDLALYVADGHARLAVRDTGPGIAPADLTRIFERFYRLDRARSRRSGGPGLGLAIARWIAAAHGGRIDVEITVGLGSTFAVVLPLSNRSVTRP
jgi:signal transduction histidine kinase